MPDYTKGKIYQIVAPNDSKYIGSTVQDLHNRFIRHKSSYNCWKRGKYHYFTCFDIFEKHGIENCKIELLEEFPCNSKKELETREGEIIKKTECVNKVIAARDSKEWMDENKERLTEYWKNYYQINKEHYIERNKRHTKENKEYNRERSRLYREKNRERLIEQSRANYHKRKMLKTSESISITE